MLWVEKYRPQTIEDCIIPEVTKKFFIEQRESKVIQNMLLSGSHGVGKTTIARALCNEIGADTMFLNCSKDNSVDDVRTKINSFSSSMSLKGGLKVAILDESDYLSGNAQAALRGVIEQVSKNCRFIFTCNFINKIIDPLKSRLLQVDFRIAPADKPILAQQFMESCCKILDSEGVKYKKNVLAKLIMKFYPDFRKVLHELQRASMVGNIDERILIQSDGELGPYIIALKDKDYKTARNWIGETAIDPGDFYHGMFTKVKDIFSDESMAQAILLLNEYQYKHAFAIDEELNLSALTVELMSGCSFKK